MDNIFYVYEWFNVDTQEVFYVGKGCRGRYKNSTRRNKRFMEYKANNNIDVRIVINNLGEQQAFEKEKEIVDYYKSIGQCSCNIADAGMGGCHFVWNQEMRDNWSKNNPMKDEKQRKRMSEKNPMKSKEVAKKVSSQRLSKIKIGEVVYNGLVVAAEKLGVSSSTIANWCLIGETPNGLTCEYIDQKKTSDKVGKPIIYNNKKYPSIASCAIENKINPSMLARAIREGKPFKGIDCRYANQQPS